jgi:3-oxoacyl-[acyl-carrier-protein] synthase II
MSKRRRVVITGIGPLSSIGIGKNAMWKNILQKKVNIKSLDNYIFGKYSNNFHIHKINDFNIARFRINPAILEDIKKWQYGDEVIDLYYLLAVIKLALDDSKLQYDDRKDIGFVLTHENPGIEQFCSTFIEKSYDIYKTRQSLSEEEYFNILNYSLDTNVNDLQTFMFLFYTAKLFNIHGYSLFINNSCASGSYAIEAASQIIKNEVNNVVIVASSEHPSIYKHLWFQKLGILSEEGKIKPFSKNRNGFICGEGGAALVLEDLEHALNRGAHIYAEYLGGVCSLESWKITVPDVSKNSYMKTILESLKKCELKPSDIDIINTHGLGAPLIDQYEAKAMTDVFGQNFKKPSITAFKPYFGHTLGNCALLETIILLLSMKENLIPPILNYEGEDSNLNIKIIQKQIHTRLKIGMKIVWGFGGYNASTIFKKID